MSLSPDNCDTLMQNDVIDVNDEIADNSTGNETEKRPSTVKTAQDAVYDADSEMVESAEEEDDKAPKQEPCSDDDRSTVIAPISRPPTEPLSRHNLKWNLRVIISNLYMKSERRLPSACVPKCLHNTTQCVSRHRCAMLPDAPDISIAQELRNNLYRQHYDTYLDILETMALQSVYPDEAVFDRLIDMIMILNTKSLTLEELHSRYRNVIRIYYLLVDAFPPCWTALRPYYLNFLGATNDNPQKLQLLLDLFEDCLGKCSETELRELTPYYEQFVHDYEAEDSSKLSSDDMFQRHVQDYDWQSGKQWVDEFKAMSPAVQLARLCDALDMICWVLEREFLAWLDHNRLQQSEPEIFQEDSKPFVLIVFGIEKDKRLTKLTQQLLRVYSRAAAKSLYADRLSILERFISLLMEASNTAELEYANNSLIYPNLGPHTRRLIAEFFKIFKVENPSDLTTYIRTISQLSQPYVRWEFADNFLRLFYYSDAAFGPEKVCEELKLKRWLKYRPRSAIDEADNEQLSREDYFKIMLNALQDYCNWFDLQACWKYIKTKTPVQQLQARTSSPLATPAGLVTEDVGKIFMLDEMQKEAHTWKQRINAKVILARPKVNLPVAKISIGTMAERYGSDIRQLRYLRRILLEVMRFEDVTDWLNYVNDFLGEDEPAVSS
ncbi:uncharacterized protein LOC6581497 [Drosophila mojavensis]|uniref:Uncharacterized protein n=1 Tax=Drosophila mojavensis TaxID=7230 RepID=B4KYC2_DROMO|nr:uncharacterized protein LOC6581497 [Drosophila mojavensis]EDW17701.1 uncharacterized protein Dmoj_GI12496 [Drosophila mojavensis]